MAVADTKELAQCLAFAYFAENPKYEKAVGKKESEHALNFYRLFSGKENVSNYKKKYLSNQFPIDKVKQEFKVTFTQSTKQESYHETAKKVYNVARECIEKGMFKYPLNQYEFLDQNDPFVLLIKDKCLDNIKKAFRLPYKIDALSAVDVFFVRSAKKKQIEADFKKYVFDTETIIHNTIAGEQGLNSYSNLIKKYFDSGDLLPVSLKLPTTISAKPNIKRIEMGVRGKISPDVDPFIKFLSAILYKPEKTKQYIDKVIHIDFDNFSMFEKLNWVFPVEFKYKNLKNEETGESLSDYNLDFDLYAQGYGAGWNGQFRASTKQFKDTQWVGGISIDTFENFATKYQKYNSIIPDLIKIRKKCFDAMCSDMQKMNRTAYEECSQLEKKASSAISKPHILYGAKRNQPLIEFFEKFDSLTKNKSEDSYTNYQLKVIDEIRGFSKKYVPFDKKRIAGHYAHAQLSFFMINGGKSFEVYFKQQMFITIFGAITKTSHTYFDINDYDKMKSIVTTTIQKEGKQDIISEFDTAPHFLIS